jgi:hypothetical protein
MGTFTLGTGLGMLAFGLAVTMIVAIGAFIVIRIQAKQKVASESRSDIEKQIDRLKEVRQG